MFNLDALKEATFSVKMVKLDDIGSYDAHAVYAELDGEKELIALCASRNVATNIKEALEEGDLVEKVTTEVLRPHGSKSFEELVLG